VIVLITRWKTKVLRVTAASAAAALACSTFSTPNDERCVILSDVKNAIAQQPAGEGTPKLNSLSLHLGTTAEGKRHADGEDQGEAVFHGQWFVGSNRAACNSEIWQLICPGVKSPINKGRSAVYKQKKPILFNNDGGFECYFLCLIRALWLPAGEKVKVLYFDLGHLESRTWEFFAVNRECFS
jgi:hypothetical protein